MKDNEIKVGDVLRVREWDDMLEEFGENLGDIDTPNAAFVVNMRPLCGSVFTISKIYTEFDDDEFYYRSEEGVEDRMGSHHWYITAGMLEPFCSDEEIEVPEDEFENDLILYMKEGIA